MSFEIDRHRYAELFGPTEGDSIRLGDTDLFIKIENDYTGYGIIDIEAMVKEYNMRRRMIVNGFNKLGLVCREPKGAFYAFPCIQATGLSSEEFCQKLLQRERVALVPGTAFGVGGEGFVRASYSYSAEHIQEALHRISRFLKGEHL